MQESYESELHGKLENCNHAMAKSLLLSRFSGSVIPNSLAALLDSYVANPCSETAISLVKFDSNFIAFFELAHEGGFTELSFRKGDIVINTKNTMTLQQEPEFNEYCDSITADTKRHNQLKEQLRSKGYSDEVIDAGFSEYWE